MQRVLHTRGTPTYICMIKLVLPTLWAACCCAVVVCVRCALHVNQLIVSRGRTVYTHVFAFLELLFACSHQKCQLKWTKWEFAQNNNNLTTYLRINNLYSSSQNSITKGRWKNSTLNTQKTRKIGRNLPWFQLFFSSQHNIYVIACIYLVCISRINNERRL